MEGLLNALVEHQNKCFPREIRAKHINPSLVLVQPRKTCPYIPERLLMGRKESNQTNKQTKRPNIVNALNTYWEIYHVDFLSSAQFFFTI